MPEVFVDFTSFKIPVTVFVPDPQTGHAFGYLGISASYRQITPKCRCKQTTGPKGAKSTGPGA